MLLRMILLEVFLTQCYAKAQTMFLINCTSCSVPEASISKGVPEASISTGVPNTSCSFSVQYPSGSKKISDFY